MYETKIKQLVSKVNHLTLQRKNARDQLKYLKIKQLIQMNLGKTFNIIRYRIEMPNKGFEHAYTSDYMTFDDVNKWLLFAINHTNVVPNPDYEIVYESYTIPEVDEEYDYKIYARVIS